MSPVKSVPYKDSNAVMVNLMGLPVGHYEYRMTAGGQVQSKNLTVTHNPVK